MEIPRLGLGTYRMTDREECVNAVTTALESGYRHVDTAQMYDNESFVGEAIAAADVPREDVFLATKLDTDNTGYDDVLATTDESRERLGVDTLDLLYVHWPTDAYDPEETLPALDALYDDGVVDHVGLSNFTPTQLETAIERLDAPVYAHQVEMHPLLQQEELLSMAQEHDHWLVAYSPIARGEVYDVPEIQAVAEKHDATPAQVSLAWLLAKENVVVIPKAANPDHVRENFGALDVDLDAADVARIDGIERTHRIVDFPSAPWNQ
jgi:diketogulonate reductase-like aldo/keto reductase